MALVNITGGMITGGLGRPACEQLISRGPGLGSFGLYCQVAMVVDVNPGGGGFYPKPAHNVLQPGDIKDFYKEVNPDKKPVEDARAYDLAQKYRVQIRFKIGEHEGQHEYVMGRMRKNFTVGIINLINKSRDRIDVAVSNIKVTTMKLAFKVKKMVTRN